MSFADKVIHFNKQLTYNGSSLRFFNDIVALEHPRYIMQYKSKSKQIYIDKYISVLNGLNKKKEKIVTAL
jgi:Domain of unknown function (DUF4918)